MRLHLIGVIQNEADIVAQTLPRALEMADYVYVRDIGSTDGTLEILRDAEARYKNLTVYSEHAPVYTDALRQTVYQKFSERSKVGDFWGRYDSDEIFLEDPHEVFRKLKRTEDVVWGSFFNFYMTEDDVARYERDPSLYADDTPIEGRVRHYINNWSEPRFVRDHGGLIWREGRDWPSLLNHCTRYRVKIAHYSFRSPKQIDARLASRWKLSANGGTVYSHDIVGDFRSRVLDSSRYLDVADEMVAQAKRKAVERNGIPDVSWKDRVVPATDLEFRKPGQALIARPELLPKIKSKGGLIGRLARRIVRHLVAAPPPAGELSKEDKG